MKAYVFHGDPWPKRDLWVVEMSCDGRWEPTVGASNRDAGRQDLAEWREDNPDDSFRLRRYRSIEFSHKEIARS